MIHSAIKLMTLVGVLLHAGLGCCAHHDHCVGDESAEAATENAAQEQHFACSCAHHRHEQPAEDREEEPEDDQCPCGHSHDGCTDHCFWLTAAKVELPDNQCEMPLAIADCDLQLTAIGQNELSWLESSPFETQYGESLRASTQVWRL